MDWRVWLRNMMAISLNMDGIGDFGAGPAEALFLQKRKCAVFSRTFLRTSVFESDRSLKRHHRDFVVWGRKFRELVECWGYALQYPERDDITEFYHGVCHVQNLQLPLVIMASC